MMRRFMRAILFVVLAIVVVIGGGFVWFVLHVPDTEVALERNADGIVVLTGGASRISDAIETRRWARDRQFTSLIVVTSAYHMPRTMAELEQQMPDVALVPFPVVTEKLRNEPWWTSGPTARLIISEYAKFVVAQLRMSIEPVPALSDSSGGRDGAKS